ncbi:MAG: murein biosynthesis integral membrane protein MurJ [Chloroflexota bacterium]|nr:murein biosynthesis integral membrane protein MurJ [Chloroflexota bacterium]
MRVAAGNDRPGARTMARSGLIVFTTVGASRLLGWVRLLVIVAIFGATSELDAYFAAFRVPDAAFGLLGAGVVGAALVPTVSGLIARGEEPRAWKTISSALGLMVVSVALLAALLAIAAPTVVPLLVPGFDPQATDLTVHLSRSMLLAPVLLAASAILGATLHVHGRFAVAGLAPIAYNACIIAAAVLLSPTLGVMALALGVVGGAATHLILQLVAVRRIPEARVRPSLDRHDPAVRRMLSLLGPRIVGIEAGQLLGIVAVAIASGYGPGVIVAYTLAFAALQVPLGLIGTPVSVVTFPALSRSAADDDGSAFRHLVGRAVDLVLFVALPLALVGIALREWVVLTAFSWGGMSEGALATTSGLLAVFLVGLTAHCLNLILSRAFYALEDTRTPVAVTLVQVAVGIIVTILASGLIGPVGLAVGTASAAWLKSAVLFFLLTRRMGGPPVALVVRHALTALGAGSAAAAAGVAVVLLAPPASPELAKLEQLVWLVCATAAATATYALISGRVQGEQLSRVVALIRTVVGRAPRTAAR